MDDYLAKPATMTQLESVIKRWFDAEQPMRPRFDLPAAAEGNQEIDLRALKSMFSKQELQQLLDDFVFSTQTDCRELLKALQHKELTTLTNVAHRIKGACHTVYAVALGNKAATIERAARAENWDLLSQSVEPFCRSAQAMFDEIWSSGHA